MLTGLNQLYLFQCSSHQVCPAQEAPVQSELCIACNAFLQLFSSKKTLFMTSEWLEDWLLLWDILPELPIGPGAQRVPKGVVSELTWACEQMSCIQFTVCLNSAELYFCWCSSTSQGLLQLETAKSCHSNGCYGS